MSWIVRTEFSTNADGAPVFGEETPYVLHGPFLDLPTAQRWMDDRPDDEDVTAMFAQPLNVP